MIAAIRTWVTSPLGMSLGGMFGAGFSLGSLVRALGLYWLTWFGLPIGFAAAALLVWLVRVTRRSAVEAVAARDITEGVADVALEHTLAVLGELSDRHGGPIPIGRCKSCGKVHPFPDEHDGPRTWN